MKKNQILLTFDSKETVDYIRLVCRRKGTDLESYIVDNFEWDDMPECFSDDGDETQEITADTCEGCDYADRCPDVVR